MSIDRKRHEALMVMREIEIEPEHVEHVAILAMRLFDQLETVHQLGEMDRLILESAAWLHDIGWSVARDGKGHHKESARLIRERQWKHWPAAEIEMVANVARYHRKSEPSAEHVDYMALSERDRNRVDQLAAMLRLADALDRSHTQRVEDIEVRIQTAELIFILTSRRPLDLEHESLSKKGKLAERIWARKIFSDRIRPTRQSFAKM